MNNTEFLKYNITWLKFIGLALIIPIFVAIFDISKLPFLSYALLLFEIFFIIMLFVISYQMISIYVLTFSYINFYKTVGYKVGINEFLKAFDYCANSSLSIKEKVIINDVEKYIEWNGYNNWKIANQDGSFIITKGFTQK